MLHPILVQNYFNFVKAEFTSCNFYRARVENSMQESKNGGERPRPGAANFHIMSQWKSQSTGRWLVIRY